MISEPAPYPASKVDQGPRVHIFTSSGTAPDMSIQCVSGMGVMASLGARSPIRSAERKAPSVAQSPGPDLPGLHPIGEVTKRLFGDLSGRGSAPHREARGSCSCLRPAPA